MPECIKYSYLHDALKFVSEQKMVQLSINGSNPDWKVFDLL